MKLENQVTSFEISAAMESAGIRCRSMFAWANPISTAIKGPVVRFAHKGTIKPHEVPAYTAAEIGEMLPTGVRYAKNYYMGKTSWSCIAGSSITSGESLSSVNEREADSRAEMLLILLRKGVFLADEINARCAG